MSSRTWFGFGVRGWSRGRAGLGSGARIEPLGELLGSIEQRARHCCNDCYYCCCYNYYYHHYCC